MSAELFLRAFELLDGFGDQDRFGRFQRWDIATQRTRAEELVAWARAAATATPITVTVTAGDKEKVLELLAEALVETIGLLVDVAPGEQETIRRAQEALALVGRGVS